MNFAHENSQPKNGLVKILSILLSSWKWIVSVTSVFVLLGLFFGLTASPVYHAYTMIAPRTQERGGAASAFAVLQGLNSGVNEVVKLEVLIRDVELAESVIVKHDLLPLLYSKYWDKSGNRWKVGAPSEQLNIKTAARDLSRNLYIESNLRHSTLRLGVGAPDSTLARDLVKYYLKALDEKLRSEIRNQSEMNRRYLELQLESTGDPVLKTRIMQLVVGEIERSMMANYQTFDVLAGPQIPEMRTSPKRKRILIISFLAGLLFASATVLFWYRAKGTIISAAEESQILSWRLWAVWPFNKLLRREGRAA